MSFAPSYLSAVVWAGEVYLNDTLSLIGSISSSEVAAKLSNANAHMSALQMELFEAMVYVQPQDEALYAVYKLMHQNVGVLVANLQQQAQGLFSMDPSNRPIPTETVGFFDKKLKDYLGFSTSCAGTSTLCGLAQEFKDESMQEGLMQQFIKEFSVNSAQSAEVHTDLEARYENVCNQLDQAMDDLEAAQAGLEQAGEKMDEALEEVQKYFRYWILEQVIDLAVSALSSFSSPFKALGSWMDGSGAAKKALDDIDKAEKEAKLVGHEAEEAISKARSAESEAKVAMEDAKLATKDAEKELNEAKKEVAQFESEGNALQKDKAKFETEVSTAQNKYNEAKDEFEKASDEAQKAKYKKEMDDAEIERSDAQFKLDQTDVDITHNNADIEAAKGTESEKQKAFEAKTDAQKAKERQANIAEDKLSNKEQKLELNSKIKTLEGNRKFFSVFSSEKDVLFKVGKYLYKAGQCFCYDEKGNGSTQTS